MILRKFFEILFLITCLTLGGCKWISNAGTPFNSLTGIKIPDGTPAFKKGFRDGCSSGFYSRGNGLYRDRYSYRFDGKMAGNSDYRFGVARGYGYCFAYMLPGAGGPYASSDRALNPYGHDKTFMANTNTVNSAWGGFFEGGDSWKNAIGSGGSIDDVYGVYQKGIKDGTAFGANPLWAGGSSGQFFGQ